MAATGKKQGGAEATRAGRPMTLLGGLNAVGRWWWRHWQEYGRAGGGMVLSRVRPAGPERGVSDAAE